MHLEECLGILFPRTRYTLHTHFPGARSDILFLISIDPWRTSLCEICALGPRKTPQVWTIVHAIDRWITFGMLASICQTPIRELADSPPLRPHSCSSFFYEESFCFNSFVLRSIYVARLLSDDHQFYMRDISDENKHNLDCFIRILFLVILWRCLSASSAFSISDDRSHLTARETDSTFDSR